MNTTLNTTPSKQPICVFFNLNDVFIDSASLNRKECELKPIQGAINMLTHLQFRNIKCILLSNLKEDITRTIVDDTGLYKSFNAGEIFCFETNSSNYTYAANSLNFQPNQCIVVAGSLDVVTATLLAEMTPLCFTGTPCVKDKALLEEINKAFGARLTASGIECC